MDITGTETGAQENAGGLPAGPEPYSPSGQVMPTDGGPGSTPTSAPGIIGSPGPDEYVIQPNVSGGSLQVGPSSNKSAPMPTSG